MDVVMRWRQLQQTRLSIGFHCWAMLCRIARDPRVLSAMEMASRAQQELRLSQLTATQRFNDAEADWQIQLEQQKAATEVALQNVHVIAAELQRSKAALDSTRGLLQQVAADRQLLTEKMRERELEETERTQIKLQDLYRKIDEDAGEREANMQMLIMKNEEIERLRTEVESLRFQVQSLPHIFHVCRQHFFPHHFDSFFFTRLSLQLHNLRSISSSAFSDSAENSTLVLELTHRLHLAKAEQLRAEEGEASARVSHAQELIRTEQLEKAKQALGNQVHVMSLEVAAARANALKEKSALIERLARAEDNMMDWKRQHDDLKGQLDNAGRVRMLQERLSAIEQKIL
jgi:hypothetical protein